MVFSLQSVEGVAAVAAGKRSCRSSRLSRRWRNDALRFIIACNCISLHFMSIADVTGAIEDDSDGACVRLAGITSTNRSKGGTKIIVAFLIIRRANIVPVKSQSRPALPVLCGPTLLLPGRWQQQNCLLL